MSEQELVNKQIEPLPVLVYGRPDCEDTALCASGCRKTAFLSWRSTPYQEYSIFNFFASFKLLGSTRIEPSGNTIVGTLRLPWFTSRT